MENPVAQAPRKGEERGIALVALVMLMSVAWIALGAKSMFTLEDSRCEMSYMAQSYSPIDLPKSIVHSDKYEKAAAKGIPVLFIPGSAGSFRQVRSFASEAAARQMSLSEEERFNFYSCNFNEEFTGFHGVSVVHQAEFLNDVISHLLQYYQQHGTTSIIVVGHSMGGIVARTMVSLPNYRPGSINTIITMATPHLAPPVSMEQDLTNLYGVINGFWRDQFSPEHYQTGMMNDMVVVSICAGNRDLLINPELVDLAPIAPPSHAFTVFTTGMPSVWTSMDHQAIVWCKQVARKLVSALIAVVDVSRPERTLVREKRIAALEGILQSPLLRTRAPKRNLASIVVKNLASYEVLATPSMLHFDKPRKFLIRHKLMHNETFTALTNMALETEIKFFLASGGAGAGEGTYSLNRVNSLAVTLPHGYLRGDKSSEFATHLSIDAASLRDYDAIVVEASPSADRFLVFDLVEHAALVTSLNHSFSELLMGIDHTFAAGHPLWSTLRIEKAINNLYSYNLQVTRDSCSADGPLFAPLVRQYTSTASEEQFRLIADDSAPAKILFHGFNSPMGAISKLRVKSLSSLDFSLEDPGGSNVVAHSGVYLQFWLDPACQYQVHMRIDWFGTLGQVARRYFPVGVTFPFAILLFCFGLQLNDWESRRQFPSTGLALSRQLASVKKFLVFFTLVSFVQANFEWIASNFSKLSGASRSAALFNANLLMDSVFLGNDDTFLLLPFLFLLSFGVAFFVNYFLKGLVYFLSLPLRFVAARSTVFADRYFLHVVLGFFLSLKPVLIALSIWGPFHLAIVFTFVYHLMTCVHSSVRWYLLTKNSRIDRFKLSDSVVLPQQQSNKQGTSDDDGELMATVSAHLQQQHMVLVLMAFLVILNAPLVVAWLRNGNVIEGNVTFFQHLRNSDIDRNFLAVAPFLLLSFLLSIEMRPSSETPLIGRACSLVFQVGGFYVMAYGVHYGYRIVSVGGIVCLFLALLHLTTRLNHLRRGKSKGE